MDLFILVLIIVAVSWAWSKSGFVGTYNLPGNSPNTGWRRVKADSSSNVPSNKRENDRKLALAKAKSFLKPYTELMGEHSLANENCKVNLIIEADGSKKIVCISKMLDKEGRRRILTATVNEDLLGFYSQPIDYVIDNMWDILCSNFSYTTRFENIYDAASQGMLLVQESSIASSPSSTTTQQVYDKVSNTQIRTNNLLNINTATEAELLALPGVNVVLAKKAIKYIEKSGGFNSVDEFIEKMKIKENFAPKIKELTCVSLNDNAGKTAAQNSGNNEFVDLDENDNSLDFFEDEEQGKYTPHSQNERIIDI